MARAEQKKFYKIKLLVFGVTSYYILLTFYYLIWKEENNLLFVVHHPCVVCASKVATASLFSPPALTACRDVRRRYAFGVMVQHDARGDATMI